MLLAARVAAARVRLSHAVFNTQWLPAGTPGAGDHDRGYGPLAAGPPNPLFVQRG